MIIQQKQNVDRPDASPGFSFTYIYVYKQFIGSLGRACKLYARGRDLKDLSSTISFLFEEQKTSVFPLPSESVKLIEQYAYYLYNINMLWLQFDYKLLLLLSYRLYETRRLLARQESPNGINRWCFFFMFYVRPINAAAATEVFVEYYTM